MFELVFGLVLGWLASQLSETVRSRRAARAAARAIRLEAIENTGELMRFRKIGMWGGTPGGPRRTAWDAFGSALILNMPEEDIMYVSGIYTMLERVRAILAIQNAPPGGEELEDIDERIREHLTTTYGPMIERTILEVDELSRRLAIRSLPTWRLLLSDVRARRTPWRRRGLERGLRALAAREAESVSPSGERLNMRRSEDFL